MVAGPEQSARVEFPYRPAEGTTQYLLYSGEHGGLRCALSTFVYI